MILQSVATEQKWVMSKPKDTDSAKNQITREPKYAEVTYVYYFRKYRPTTLELMVLWRLAESMNINAKLESTRALFVRPLSPFHKNLTRGIFPGYFYVNILSDEIFQKV